MVLALPVPARAAGIPLLDAGGGSHGSVSLNLGRGLVTLKITSLAPLPVDVSTGTETFTAHLYKAYLSSSADAAVEIFLGDVYPSAKQRAKRKTALGGDVSRMGFDRVTVTAFSKDGLKSFDVLTASLAP
jgi:hypothetical protein